MDVVKRFKQIQKELREEDICADGKAISNLVLADVLDNLKTSVSAAGSEIASAIDRSN